MNRQNYMIFHRQMCDKMMKITEAKNADYAGDGKDAFANFTRVEAMGVCTTEIGFMTRMLDKFSRVSSFLSNGELKVKDESVEDTLLDLANYSLLFLGYLESKKAKTQTYQVPSGAPSKHGEVREDMSPVTIATPKSPSA